MAGQCGEKEKKNKRDTWVVILARSTSNQTSAFAQATLITNNRITTSRRFFFFSARWFRILETCMDCRATGRWQEPEMDTDVRCPESNFFVPRVGRDREGKKGDLTVEGSWTAKWNRGLGDWIRVENYPLPPPSPSHPLLFVSRLRNWTAAIPLDRIEPTASHDTGRDTGYNHRFRAGAIAWNEFYARLKLDCVDWHLNKNNAKGDAWFSIDACPISERQSGSLITEINGFPGKLTNSTFPLLQLMNECLTKTRLSLIRMNGLTFEATKCLGRWESNCRDNRVIYKRILNVGRIIYSNDDVSNSISSYLLASCYFKWLVSLFERKNGFSICRWCPAIWRNNFSFHFLFRTWIISSLFVILFE